MRHEAILNLYKNVVSVSDDYGIFDADGNQVSVDETLVAQEAARLQAIADANAYKAKRAAEYPPITNYIDGVVKGDQAQIQAYIDACLAVKAKYPKEQS
jgi:hypothetical protein